MYVASRLWKGPAAVRLTATLSVLALLAGVTHATAQAGAAVPDERGADAAAQRSDDRPNIVVIMADDMRADDIRYMPATRRLLGDQGLTFANSFSPYPLCCPARASFLSGQYSHNHEVWSHKAPYGFASFRDESTLPVWLSDAGYQTGFTGKYLNGYGTQPQADGTSSTTYVPPGWTDWRGAIDGGVERDSALSGGTYRYFNTTLNVNGRLTSHDGEYQTEMLGDQSIDMINGFTRRDSPFFLYTSFVAPHHGGPSESDDPRPVRANDGERTRIKTPARPRWVRGMFDDVITSPPGLSGDRQAPLDGKPRFMQSSVPINAAERRSMLTASRQRAESVYVLDQQVERVVERLRRLGELRNTIIAFTSDNGYFAGEFRIRQGKVLPYEPSLRVPLLMRGPGIPGGEVRRAPISTVDIAPTFARIAGARPDTRPDGRVMRDTFARDRAWDRGILTETGARSVLTTPENAGAFQSEDVRGAGKHKRFSNGLRTDEWLYVEHATGEKEMYDMRTDRGQHDNVVRLRKWAGERRLLAAELQRLKNCSGAQCTSRLPRELRSPARQIVSGRGQVLGQ